MRGAIAAGHPLTAEVGAAVLAEGGNAVDACVAAAFASCAVPGNAAGLEAAHRAFGSLPWPRLVEPAVELAHDGFELTRQQAYLHAILDVILRHTPEGRRVYPKRSAGQRLRLPDLGDTLERIAARGARELYHGELGRALVAHLG